MKFMDPCHIGHKRGNVKGRAGGFRDGSGVVHTIRSSGGSNPPRFPVGAKVSVLYRTQNPDAAFLEDHFMFWTAPALLFALCGFYGAAGCLISRFSPKKESRNAA